MEKDQDILRARAELLARPLAQISTQQKLQIVEFALAKETYAFALEYVKKVVPMQDIVPLPGTPNFVVGITSYLGQVVAVIDLRVFFDLPITAAASCRNIIVLQSGTIQLAVVAEFVHDVTEILQSQLQTDLPTLTGVRARYLCGVSPQQTIVLDALSLLEDEKLVVS